MARAGLIENRRQPEGWPNSLRVPEARWNTRRRHRRQPETPNVWVRGANGRRVSRGRFRVVGCGAFRLGFDGGLGGEAEETALFLPVMRQVFAQSRSEERRG